ncbi:hypothetical protein K458DRAFT_382335 [Lentithecium fluviatile CBS 122367]|uniref:Uncharacterized protein n=1 Tax=Lentithecium fluviatile CBS 122367 TaxID=1168545 RepID=A0A6G1JK08_9PLEO|nr:hypothetical protein K458DRAFT_382335 [Lentithecium fluviatile CBS 122367]
MPRTDFVAQYTKFIEPKLKDQLSDKKTSLYNTIEKASGAGKAGDHEAGTLEVEQFLKYVQGVYITVTKTLTKMNLVKLMDKTMRHGQIESLGSKMETILGTSELVPIFEFRELAPVLGSAFGAAMGSYENKVIEYHKQFAKRSIDVQEVADMLQEE